MTAPAPQTKRMVKIRALTNIWVTQGNEKIGLAPGAVAEVSEAEAAEFCDRIFTGQFGPSGEHSTSFAEANRVKTKRAERV